MSVGAGQAPNAPIPRLGTDARALFNPAFVAVLIARAAAGHRRERDASLPLALGYLVAPMVLHTPTRDALPRVNARLARWADEHQLVRAELRWRAPQLSSVTRHALRFGLRHELIGLTPAGIDAAPAVARLPAPDSGDASDCWKKAELLGRWLPRAGPPATVLALLGVRP
jgi:ABC-3C biological conflict system middle component